MIELGEVSYKFRWQQAGEADHVTSARRFDTLDEVEKLCKRLNFVWQKQLIHWPVKYEAQTVKSGKPGWVEVEEVFA